MFHADLHIHSRYSRATSRDCDLEHLALWAARKGLSVLGTGDFTHPEWRREIKKKLAEAEPGLFRLKRGWAKQSGLSDEYRVESGSDVRFMLQGEISTIYKKGDKTRKVHHIVFAPDFASADRIAERLDAIGNITSDGRPILGLDSHDLLEIVLESGEGTFLVPAHIWTPWFSLLGSKSGFDSMEECYDELASHIFAVETGLSSDPPMNWRVSNLDSYRLISNSDAHSPSKLGREACVFDTGFDYFEMRRALETGQGYGGTIEFFPEEGKYHLDGHRKCGVRLMPEESLEKDCVCPVCGKPMTLGVMHRVNALADRPDGEKPGNAAGYISLIPLREIISETMGVGPQSKRVAKEYERLVRTLGPELEILASVSPGDIEDCDSSMLAEGIRRMREGQVVRDAGYDGEFGRIKLFDGEDRS